MVHSRFTKAVAHTVRTASRVIGGCVLLGVAAGCASRNDAPRMGDSAEATMTPAGTADSLSFTLEVPAKVALGAPVPVRLRLTNVSARPLELHLTGRETVFDVIATDRSGREVWRRLGGQPVLAILQLRPLAAGETLEFNASWDQTGHDGTQVPPGSYRLVGELPGDTPTPLRTAPGAVQVTSDPTTARE